MNIRCFVEGMIKEEIYKTKPRRLQQLKETREFDILRNDRELRKENMPLCAEKVSALFRRKRKLA